MSYEPSNKSWTYLQCEHLRKNSASLLLKNYDTVYYNFKTCRGMKGFFFLISFHKLIISPQESEVIAS